MFILDNFNIGTLFKNKLYSVNTSIVSNAYIWGSKLT